MAKRCTLSPEKNPAVVVLKTGKEVKNFLLLQLEMQQNISLF